uniref:Integron gene cassette protein n=1 Tax=Macrostomum lignano TaxID=282301 RepID=A0A1I8JQE0_9PLAT
PASPKLSQDADSDAVLARRVWRLNSNEAPRRSSRRLEGPAGAAAAESPSPASSRCSGGSVFEPTQRWPKNRPNNLRRNSRRCLWAALFETRKLTPAYGGAAPANVAGIHAARNEPTQIALSAGYEERASIWQPFHRSTGEGGGPRFERQPQIESEKSAHSGAD